MSIAYDGDDRIERELKGANDAKKLNNKFLDAFFDTKDRQLWEAFGQTRLGDAAALAEIHHQYKSMNALRSEVQTVINTGKLAQAEKDAKPPA